jgi:hypothetical protein
MQEAAGIITGMGVQLAEIYVYGSKNQDARSIDGLNVRGMRLLHNPASKTAGVTREDHGYQDRQTDSGGYMPAHAEYFITRFGLAVEHPDAVKRVCSIPADGSLYKDGRAVLIDMVLHAQKLLPPAWGRRRFTAIWR